MISPLTLFHTVRHLRPVQVYKRLYRPRPKIDGKIRLQIRNRNGHWVSPVLKPNPHMGPGQFQFLNQRRRIQTWNDPGVPKLWLYNLHYFDHLDEDLIEKWTAENPPGAGNGWEPYPLSLRIVNWIKWAMGGGHLSAGALHSLHLQAEYLSQAVEHHLGANHLFANAVALTIAGLFFDDSNTLRWLRQGLRLVDRELREQILSDGAHYERSPMYHCIILESLLDLINTARAVGSELYAENDWSDKAAMMLSWLDNMVHPDGQISFFNDAAFGIASEPAELNKYAKRLGILPREIPLGSSGYVRLSSADSTVIFDAAALGPDHQPGHAHADALSFELSHCGKRVLVNSGISTYERGAEREFQRGTSAHNTVMIDEADQSEVWDSFRVGRRARTFDTRTDGATFVEAAHNGYRRLRNGIVHRRLLRVTGTHATVTDRIEGQGRHSVDLFFHLHPEATADIRFDCKLKSKQESTFWYPEFNKAVPNRTFRGSWVGICPIEFTTQISFA